MKKNVTYNQSDAVAPSSKKTTEKGAQRHSLKKLHKFESLGFGMFIHFGMSTFVAQECPDGKEPSKTYAPDKLDVEQWVKTARDCGMKYAVLTAKHVSGHCLWPSKHTDYHVGTSGCKTDVVEAFVTACNKYGLMPGLYYCSWDEHHKFGSVTWKEAPLDKLYTTRVYRDFQMAQIEELLTQYGKIGEVWIDIPGALGHDGRREQYRQIAALQPQTFIMFNNGVGDGSTLRYDYSWPTDLMPIERFLPNSNRGYNPWQTVEERIGEAKRYYLPGEVCEPIGYEWFYMEGDRPRSDAELLGMYLISRERNTNLLLDVPPDIHGLIPKASCDALMRLKKNIDSFYR
jgi:alpha-L-fucosidase